MENEAEIKDEVGSVVGGSVGGLVRSAIHRGDGTHLSQIS